MRDFVPTIIEIEAQIFPWLIHKPMLRVLSHFFLKSVKVLGLKKISNLDVKQLA